MQFDIDVSGEHSEIFRQIIQESMILNMEHYELKKLRKKL